MQNLEIELSNLEIDYNQLYDKIELIKKDKDKLIKINEKLKGDINAVNNEIVRAVFLLSSNKKKENSEVK